MTKMPQFVIVIGGYGSGKNYYIRNHPVYSTFELIDVDVFRNDTGVRISNIKNVLKDAMMQGVDIAHPATSGAALSALTNKLKMAKEHGYETTLVLIDTDPQVAAHNIAHRVSGGGHGAEIQQWKLEKVNAGARDNFNAVKDDKSLVDHSQVVMGGRAMNEIRLLRDFIKSALFTSF